MHLSLRNVIAAVEKLRINEVLRSETVVLSATLGIYNAMEGAKQADRFLRTITLCRAPEKQFGTATHICSGALSFGAKTSGKMSENSQHLAFGRKLRCK